MPRTYCLEVSGDFACFTRPEMKVERVSYDIITPSAVRAVFEAILWKPAIRWVPTKIETLNPIRWVSVRRNEVGSKISARNAESAMNKGSGDLGLYVEDERQQRAGLFLRDVKYRLYAHFEINAGDHRPNYPKLANVVQDAEDEALYRQPNTPEKFLNMFERRAKKGQCINQPYLGCREFACDFRLVDTGVDKPDWSSLSPVERRELGFDAPRELGWMLYDMDFGNPADPMPRFFNAKIEKGVVNIPDWNSKEVRG
jgi:CRISPR-associated protein Cas5d